MDWDEIYKEWSLSKLPDGSGLFSDKLIPKFKAINTYNRERYLEYHNHFFEESGKNPSSYKGYRASITDFLVSPTLKSKRINEITQQDLENYFNLFKGTGKKSSITNKLRHVKDFTFFHKDKLKEELSFRNMHYKKNELQEDKDNVPTSFTSEEVEEYRHRYHVQPLKLFLFEMIYYTGISLNDLRYLNYNSFDKEKGVCILKNRKELKVPQRVMLLVERLKDHEYLNNVIGYHELIIEIKEELRKWGIAKNFKYSDITKTREVTAFITCPECRNRYEAIADNWVGKVYHEKGNVWIVCKERCARNE